MTYYNLICEELCVTGGKVIHVDTNVKNMEEVHKIVCDNISKFPNGKWELYPMQIII
nr:MAG TPA: hypothetical protein [Bacteriophage sp.]